MLKNTADKASNFIFVSGVYRGVTSSTERANRKQHMQELPAFPNFKVFDVELE